MGQWAPSRGLRRWRGQALRPGVRSLGSVATRTLRAVAVAAHPLRWESGTAGPWGAAPRSEEVFRMRRILCSLVLLALPLGACGTSGSGRGGFSSTLQGPALYALPVFLDAA